MKPFDFNQFAAGAPALTPDGRKVTFVHFASNLKIGYPVTVHIEGAETLTSITVDGRMMGKQFDIPLTMAKVKRTVFVNLYRRRDRSIRAGDVYDSPEEADRQRDGSQEHLGTFPIEIEE